MKEIKSHIVSFKSVTNPEKIGIEKLSSIFRGISSINMPEWLQKRY